MRPRQRKFIDFYLKTSNAFEAARLAGYSPGCLHVSTWRLMKNPAVKGEIEKGQALIRETTLKEAENAGLSVAETLNRLADIARNGEFETNRLNALNVFTKIHALQTDKVEAKIAAIYQDLTIESFAENKG